MRAHPETERRPGRGASGLRWGFIAAGILATIVVVVAIVRQDNDSGLRQSLERQAVLSRVLSDLQDAESTQRGYLLTGHSRYEQSYAAAVSRVASDLRSLEDVLSSEPLQMAWVARLRALAASRLGELDLGLELTKAGDHAGAIAAAQPRDDGTRMVEAARSYIGQVAAIEADAIDERKARSRFVGIAMSLTAAGLVGLMMALALTALREARRREVLARYLPAEIAAQLADEAPIPARRAPPAGSHCFRRHARLHGSRGAPVVE